MKDSIYRQCKISANQHGATHTHARQKLLLSLAMTTQKGERRTIWTLTSSDTYSGRWAGRWQCPPSSGPVAARPVSPRGPAGPAGSPSGPVALSGACSVTANSAKSHNHIRYSDRLLKFNLPLGTSIFQSQQKNLCNNSQLNLKRAKMQISLYSEMRF